MSALVPFIPDPNLDLFFERDVDVPLERVWAAWTQPELITQWFTPAPWVTAECDIELRPGGRFRTLMRSPEGEEFDNTGCYLEVVENQRLVWTGLLGPGYRPMPDSGPVPFTAVITLEPTASGTRYSALAIHGTPDVCARHAELGFHDGWGTALDQLVALAKSM